MQFSNVISNTFFIIYEKNIKDRETATDYFIIYLILKICVLWVVNNFIS